MGPYLNVVAARFVDMLRPLYSPIPSSYIHPHICFMVLLNILNDRDGVYTQDLLHYVQPARLIQEIQRSVENNEQATEESELM